MGRLVRGSVSLPIGADSRFGLNDNVWYSFSRACNCITVVTIWRYEHASKNHSALTTAVLNQPLSH